MRIGIDIRKLHDSGIGTYIQNLLSAFALLEQENTYSLFVAPQDAATLTLSERFTAVCNDSPKYSVSELFSVSRQANRESLDVFHAPHFTLPFNLKAKRVVTIHDLIHLRFPQYFPPHKSLFARQVIAHACRAADVIIADSEFSRNDILAEFPVAADKIEVVHLGTNPAFRVIDDAGRQQRFRREQGIEGPYILYAGNFKPHKNLPVLLQSFARLRSTQYERMVLVGDRIERYPDLQRLIAELRMEKRVQVLGHISLDDLVLAYNAAHVVVMPSRYEGFGFPPLESMACGTPVISSNATSLPEVVGDAGLLFGPDNVEELTAYLERMAADDGLRRSLIQRGLRRVTEFSTTRTAQATLNIYRQVAAA